MSSARNIALSVRFLIDSFMVKPPEFIGFSLASGKAHCLQNSCCIVSEPVAVFMAANGESRWLSGQSAVRTGGLQAAPAQRGNAGGRLHGKVRCGVQADSPAHGIRQATFSYHQRPAVRESLAALPGLPVFPRVPRPTAQTAWQASPRFPPCTARPSDGNGTGRFRPARD